MAWTATALMVMLSVVATLAAAPEQMGQVAQGVWQTPINEVLTPAGTQVPLPGIRPQVLALSPNGKLLATSGQTSELLLINPKTGELIQRVALPANPGTNLPAGPAPAPMLQFDRRAQASFTG